MTISSERFDSIATNFATSEVHRSSPSITLLHSLLPDTPAEITVCDVAAGAGHLGFSFGRRLRALLAVDPAPAMLDLCRDGAADKGLPLETLQSTAEEMAPADRYDVVCARLAPHHFYDVDTALARMVGATAIGGHVAVIDLQGHEDPRLDGINHQLEVLHDPTHVRSYTPSRWRALFEDAGLVDVQVCSELSERPQGVPVERWCAIADSGAAASAAIRVLLAETSNSDLAELGIRPDAEHDWLMPVRTALVLGRRPGLA